MNTVSLLPLILSLLVAGTAIWISVDTQEEIVCLFSRGIAVFSLFLALSFIPWFLLLVLVVTLLRFNLPKIEQSTH